MAKIITISGKSASGKNYIFNSLLKKYPSLIPVVTHTTRPKRDGEVHGRDYFYTNSKEFMEMIGSGEIFEFREYNTKSGKWYYGTSTSQIDLKSDNIYIAIVDIKGLKEYISQFGANNIVSYYIKADAGIRLLRMLKRETDIDEEKKNEMIRRFESDNIDFKRAEDFCRYTVYNNCQEDLDMTLELLSYEIEKGMV